MLALIKDNKMKRPKYKRYKKYKHLLKDSIARILQQSSKRAKEQLKLQGTIRLIRDLERNEYE